jgi:hypothetical protein
MRLSMMRISEILVPCLYYKSHVPIGRFDGSFIGTRRDQTAILPLAAVSTLSPKKNHSYIYIQSSVMRW